MLDSAIQSKDSLLPIIQPSPLQIIVIVSLIQTYNTSSI